MDLFRTVVGIDPSGKRLAVSAFRFGLGHPSVAAPAAVFELRGEREQARLEETERILLDFVTRYGLSGAEARLAIPADKAFLARISLPPLREKDLRPALSLELDRVFPFPASRLRFDWSRSGGERGRDKDRRVVAAVPSEYLGAWEEIVSRAGLSLAGAVPSAWALSAACRRAEEPGSSAGPLGAIVRDLDGAVECTAMEAGEPFFSAVRACSPEEAPEEVFSLLAEALVDAPAVPEAAGVRVFGPPGWLREGRSLQPGGLALHPVDGFEERAAAVMTGEGGKTDSALVWGAIGAVGAALCDRGLDLLSPETRGAGFRGASRAAAVSLAAVALLLGLSWPAAVSLRTKHEVNRLDAEIAALRPEVARVEETIAALGGVEGRIAILREERTDRAEPLLILRQLTELLPQGTWLTGLRLEGRKVEIDGFSPSANEIFPLLSRDGRFRKVEFASPITRQADNMERFQIRAEFAPASPNKAEGGGKP